MATIEINIGYGRVKLSQSDYNKVLNKWEQICNERKQERNKEIIDSAKKAVKEVRDKYPKYEDQKEWVVSLCHVESLLNVVGGNTDDYLSYIYPEKEATISIETAKMLESGEIKIKE